MLGANRVRRIWKRIGVRISPATYRVRGALDPNGGYTFTDYALTHVDGGELRRYDSAGAPDATADSNLLIVYRDDLDRVGAPIPRRHDLMVWSGRTYEIQSVVNTLFDQVFTCQVIAAGPGDAP